MVRLKLARVDCVAQKVAEAPSCDEQNHYTSSLFGITSITTKMSTGCPT